MSEINHSEKGSGYPLVLIHGFCETNRIWDRFAENLASDYRILLPDLPGFGRSPLPAASFTIADIGLKVIHWMDELQLENPVVIGHSLGGYVTLAMAMRNPDGFRVLDSSIPRPMPIQRRKKKTETRSSTLSRARVYKPTSTPLCLGFFSKKRTPTSQRSMK